MKSPESKNIHLILYLYTHTLYMCMREGLQLYQNKQICEKKQELAFSCLSTRVSCLF